MSPSKPPRYRFVRELGRGGMGSVRLVHDEVRGQDVAMKRVLGGVRPNDLLRFKREFRAVERLIHPNLVRLYELGEDERGPYFTMEVVDGTDLRTACTREASVDPASDLPGSTWTAAPGEPAPGGGTRTLTATATPREIADAPAPAPAPVDAIRARPCAGVAAPPAVDLDRLARLLPQLVEGLAHLHAHGIVHRDLKPANVLATAADVLKLLDFGILGQMGDEAGEASGHELVGTLAYMAPECFEGGRPGPAIDLYALGTILFELFAGRRPFEGSLAEVAQAHRQAPVPDLRELAPDAPVAIAEACAALLAKEAGQRPTLPELAERLLPALGARSAVLSATAARRGALVGREGERERLRALLDGATTRLAVGVLEGASGVGKSRLLEHLADEARARGLVVLRGEGRPTDRVAFNVIDRAIDELGRWLQRHGPGLPPTLREARRKAATAFPALALDARRAAPHARTDGEREGDRADLFESLVALLEGAARARGGMLLCLDDLQWADADAVSFLRYLGERAPAGIGIVATLRDDEPGGPAGAWLESLAAADRAHVDRIHVDPLGPGEIRAIFRAARAHAASGGGAAGELGEPGDEIEARACEVAAGIPYLAEVAGRTAVRQGAAAPGPIASPLALLFDELPPADGRLLALLAAREGSCDSRELSALLGRAAGSVEDSLTDLERDGLVRRISHPGAEAVVDLYHDSVRRGLLDRLGERELAAAHHAFADHLLAGGGAAGSSARLVRHLLGAGRAPEASVHARTAARQAEDRRAYHLAADLYEVALRHARDDRPALLERRGAALEKVGHYLASVQCWHELAAGAPGPARRAALFREAGALLAANEIELGRDCLDRALRESGEPVLGRPDPRSLRAGVRFLLGPRSRRSGRTRPGTGGADAAELAARDVSMGRFVGYFEPLQGIRYLVRARDRFDALGLDGQAAECDLSLAFYAQYGTPGPGPVALERRYREAALRRLGGGATADEWGTYAPVFLDGFAAFRRGRWDEATERIEQVLAAARDRGFQGRFDVLYARYLCMLMDFLRQDPRRLTRSRRELAVVLDVVGESSLRAQVVFAESWQAWLDGRFADAVAPIEQLVAELPASHPTIQRAVAAFWLHYPARYGGDPGEHRRALLEALRRGRPFRLQRNLAASLVGSVMAMAEAAALRAGDRRASRRRVVRHARRALAGIPGFHAAAHRALAYAADADGADGDALRHLEDAERTASLAGQPAELAIARHQRGLRLGGDAGAALRAEASAILEERGLGAGLLAEDVGHR